MEFDFSSTSVMKTRPSDSVTLTKLLELVFVDTGELRAMDGLEVVVEMMVDAGELRARDAACELRAMDGLEPMGSLDFEKKEPIVRFFELAMVSAVGAREALDAAKPLRLQKLEVFCFFARTVL